MNLKTMMMLGQILAELKTLNANLRPKVKRNQKPNPGICPFNLEKAYAFYPRKEGKTAGMATLSRTIASREDYTNLLKAVDNYASYVRANKTEKKFIKQFSTFANCWRDYIQPMDPETGLKKESIKIEEPSGFLI